MGYFWPESTIAFEYMYITWMHWPPGLGAGACTVILKQVQAGRNEFLRPNPICTAEYVLEGTGTADFLLLTQPHFWKLSLLRRASDEPATR